MAQDQAKAERIDAQEIYRLLHNVRKLLRRRKFPDSTRSVDNDDDNDNKLVDSTITNDDAILNSKYAVAAPTPATEDAEETLSITDLLYSIRDAHRASVYSNRRHDDKGPRRVFDFLTSPGTHQVMLQTHEVDIVFNDDLSLAERCGIIRCTNSFNFIFAVFNLTIGVLVRLVIYPICIFIIAGVYSPDEDSVGAKALLWMWLFQHVALTAWMISYIVSYGHIGGMLATLKADPLVTTYTLLASLLYTVSSIGFSPSVWNVSAVIQRFVFDVHKILFGGTIVFFKLRDRREDFEKYFAPKKGCFGVLWVAGDVILWCVDIGRHMAILYSAQVMLEEGMQQVVLANETKTTAAGGGGGGGARMYQQEEEMVLAGLTVAGRAFHITLKQVMNASFTCSVLFGATTVLNAVRGSIGSAFPNLRRRSIVNTK